MIVQFIFDLPCLLIVCSGILGALIACPNRRQALALAALICLAIGAMGTLIGWVKMRSNLSVPEAFGKASSVATLPLLYAFMLWPILRTLSTRFPEQSSPTDPDHGKVQIRWLSALTVIAAVLLAAIGWKSSMVAYVDLIAIILVAFFVGLPSLLQKESTADSDQLLSRCISMRHNSLVCTTIGTLFGCASLLWGGSDHTLIGPMMAVPLLTTLYCGFIVVGTTVSYQVLSDKADSYSQSHILAYTGLVALTILMFNAVLFWIF